MWRLVVVNVESRLRGKRCKRGCRAMSRVTRPGRCRSHEEPSCPTKAERAWAQAVAFTRDRSPASFDQWFSGVQFDGFTDGVLSLRARDEFVRQWVEDYFLPTISEWLRAHTGLSVQVRWIIDVALERPVAERPSSFAPVRPRAISVRPRQRPPRSEATPTRRRRACRRGRFARRARRARVRGAAAHRGAQPEVHVRELRRRPVQPARPRRLDGGRGRAAAAATTRSSSAAARASARRTSSTPSPTASARSGPTRASSTSAPSAS